MSRQAYEPPALTFVGNVNDAIRETATRRQMALDAMNRHFGEHAGCASRGRQEMCEEGDRLYAEFLRAERTWREAGKPDLF